MIVDLKPRVVELGKIKIGRSVAQEGKTWRRPEKLDHFVITGLDRDPKSGDFKPDAALMKRLAEITGSPDGKVREIPVALLSDDPEECFPTAYVWYDGKRRLAQSDGESITWFVDPKTMQPLATPKVTANANQYVQTALDNKGRKMFKPHGVLNVVIRDSAARWGGVYKFRTTSWISIEQIYSGLVQAQALTRGFLAHVPLRLVVRPMQVSPEGKTTTVYVCHIELAGADLTAIQSNVLEAKRTEIALGNQLSSVQREYRKLLAAPGDETESEEEQAEVAEEFAPPAEAQQPVQPQRPAFVTQAQTAPQQAPPVPKQGEETPKQAAPVPPPAPAVRVVVPVVEGAPPAPVKAPVVEDAPVVQSAPAPKQAAPALDPIPSVPNGVIEYFANRTPAPAVEPAPVPDPDDGNDAIEPSEEDEAPSMSAMLVAEAQACPDERAYKALRTKVVDAKRLMDADEYKPVQEAMIAAKARLGVR